MANPYRFLILLLPILALALLVTWMPRMTRDVPEPSIEQPDPIEPPELTPEQRELELAFERIGGDFAGTVGIAAVDVQDGATIEYNGLDPYPQQSVSKLWVTMTALAQADADKLDLGERVTLRREDLTVFYQPLRDIVNARGSFSTDYADLIQRAITRSDNTANDRILRRVGGPDAVEEFLEDRELLGVRFGTDERTKQSLIAGLSWNPAYSLGNAFYEARDLVPEAERRAAFEAYLADPIDGATPVGIAVALARLMRGELLSSVSTELLLATMEQTRSGPRRLKGGAPAGWSVGHKTGTGQFFDGEQSGFNDIGVLTSPEGREYSVAVMIARTRAPTIARMQMMQEVVRAIVRYDAAVQEAAAAELEDAEEPEAADSEA